MRRDALGCQALTRLSTMASSVAIAPTCAISWARPSSVKGTVSAEKTPEPPQSKDEFVQKFIKP